MTQTNMMVRLAGVTIPCRCHVCGFFNSRDEEYQVFVPFMKEGLENGDRAMQIASARQNEEQLVRLEEAGAGAKAARQSGQLEALPWDQAHLRGGRFDPDAMIALLEEVATANERQGPGLTRLWANMGWALEDFPGVHGILEYESRVNDVLPNYDMATVCAYDVAKFSASLIMDVLRTHPFVIMGGVLRENPFYVPPREFLKELRSRTDVYKLEAPLGDTASTSHTVPLMN